MTSKLLTHFRPKWFRSRLWKYVFNSGSCNALPKKFGDSDRAGIIEFTGPRGVSKTFLLTQLSKATKSYKLKHHANAELDSFRSWLQKEKTATEPELAELEMRRLLSGTHYSRMDENLAVLLDEHLAQHLYHLLINSLGMRIDGLEFSFKVD